MSKARDKSIATEAGESVKDLMPETPDLNAERLAKLKELFPDLFTNEGSLNETELRKLVDPNSVSETERYEFRWFGKSNAKRKAFTPTRATLNYDAARSVNPDTSENLIIEGENLKVLKLLLCSYREHIKCIYIDPPYNTGKDFVYSDNYTEDRLPYWKQTGVVDEYGVKVDTNAETDGRFHSNWMNMMYSRLLIARQLLSSDGVIFISIDDNEVHNLRRLCNEVFGEDNFVENIIWKKRSTPPNDKIIGANHDYITVFCKNKEFLSLNLRRRSEEQLERYQNPDNHPKGPWTPGDLMANVKGGRYVASLYFPITNPNTGEDHYPSQNGNWRFNKKKIQELLANNEIYFGEDGKGRPKLKRFLSEVKEGITYPTIWDFVPLNVSGSNEMQEIFGNMNIFDNPKPSGLLNEIFKLGSKGDEIILDFFAGAGSTGQAVMELNEEDGGNRKFILVQLPELTDEKSEAHKAGYKRISDITIERNKRVVKKLVEEKRAKHPNLFEDEKEKDALKGLGFKVFRLESSYFPRTEWNPDPTASEAENVESLKKYIAEKESQLHIDFDRDKLLIEILLKEGFKLNYAAKPYEAITTNNVLHVSDGDKEALICLDDSIAPETVEHFKSHKDLRFICLERALDTTKKWNLSNNLGEKFKAI